jgi:Protein of unknown function (DUF3306)
MNNAKEFLARWSQRKREAANRAADQHRADQGTGVTSSLSSRTPKAPILPSAPSGGGKGGGGEVDPGSGSPSALADGPRLSRSTAVGGAAAGRSAGTTRPKLPPLESITAQTDIRPFLAPGVPVELARAALRRVWAADPAIRDHIGLAENSWDFNAPGSIPGFGPLEITDAVNQAVNAIVQPPVEPMRPAEPSRSTETGLAPHNPVEDAPAQKADESQKCEDAAKGQTSDVAAQPEKTSTCNRLAASATAAPCHDPVDGT